MHIIFILLEASVIFWSMLVKFFDISDWFQAHFLVFHLSSFVSPKIHGKNTQTTELCNSISYIKCIKLLNKPTQIHQSLPLFPLNNILNRLPLLFPSLLFIQLPLSTNRLSVSQCTPQTWHLFFLLDIQKSCATNHWKSPKISEKKQVNKRKHTVST